MSEEKSINKKRQSTLFAGPGAVKVRLINKRNKVHFILIDSKMIKAITKKSNNATVDHMCLQCRKLFTNKQGLGGHHNQ